MAVSRLSKQSIQAGFPKQQTIWDQSTSVAGMDPISGITLSSAQSSVTFSSIPQTYTHLQIRGIGGVTGGTTGTYDMAIFFNGTTSNNGNFSQHRLYGNGSSVSSDYYSGYIVSGRFSFNTDANSGIFGSTVIDILDYANVNKYKTVRTLTGVDSNGAGIVGLTSGLWQSTSAITSITLNDGFGGANWHQYSSFALYGIL